MVEYFKLMFWSSYIRGENPFVGLFRGLIYGSFIPIVISFGICWLVDVSFLTFWGMVFSVIWEHIAAFFSCIFDEGCMAEWRIFIRKAIF